MGGQGSLRAYSRRDVFYLAGNSKKQAIETCLMLFEGHRMQGETGGVGRL
jgi:hypothetical protein